MIFKEIWIQLNRFAGAVLIAVASLAVPQALLIGSDALAAIITEVEAVVAISALIFCADMLR